MPRPRHEADQALAELYAQVPAIPGCLGKCWVSCGPIDMADRERQRIRQAGYRISDHDSAKASADTYWCEALDGAGRCAVYELRPLVCRLWGTTRSMACPFGCQPERWLTEAEAARLLILSGIAGGMHGSPHVRTDVDGVLADLAPLQRLYLARARGEQLRIIDMLSQLGEVTPPPEVARRKIVTKS